MARICMWDFTLKHQDQDLKLLKDNLCSNCKKWVFQEEIGTESGYHHYQGRFSLMKKHSLSSLVSLFNNYPSWKGVHFSPTSKEVATTNNFNYVTKDDTRVAGPWADTDEVLYIPRQVREMKELRPFQKTIIENADLWNKRTINLIYCTKGNVGKSLLVGYCRAHKIGRALPPVNDQKDLLRMVCDLPTSPLYLFDMPRSMNKDRLYQFYSAVETIKDGYAYDDRYKFREKVFDCPNIWIFSNHLPDFEMLSKDRWKIWVINKKYELEDYVIAEGTGLFFYSDDSE